jgi:flagellar biogenesis protein FliO
MPVIAALRETEAWSPTSVVLGLLLVVVVVGYISWRVRRFLQDR